MIRHVVGNLFNGDVDIIAHQVNCQGIMGSGVAKQVRERFPNVFRYYRHMCERYQNKPELLGSAQFVSVKQPDGRHITIANLFAQLTYGYDKRLYTSYDALRASLRRLNQHAVATNSNRIGLPYKIGCDRGGGDWGVVYKIICEELHDCDVTLFELPK